jgi:hypothetical protein
MATLAVLNNLSYPSMTEPIPPPADAATAIDHLVATLRALRRQREDLALVTEDSLPSLVARLSPTWQPDRRNHDKRLFLKGLAAKAPFSTVLTKDQQDFVEYTCDYTWQGKRATDPAFASRDRRAAGVLGTNPAVRPTRPRRGRGHPRRAVA